MPIRTFPGLRQKVLIEVGVATMRLILFAFSFAAMPIVFHTEAFSGMPENASNSPPRHHAIHGATRPHLWQRHLNGRLQVQVRLPHNSVSETAKGPWQRAWALAVRTRLGCQSISAKPTRCDGTLGHHKEKPPWSGGGAKRTQVVINGWLRQYNHVRQHKALNM